MQRALLVCVVLAGSVRAHADLGSQFALSPRALGLGGAYTAVADDVAALYYNPAGLVQLQGFSANVGVLVGAPWFREDGRALGMPTETSWSLGLGLPLGGRLKDYLAFGFAAYIPFGKLINATLYRKQDPYFVLYDASTALLQLRFGVAARIPWRPLRFLSFGVALQVLGSVVGNVSLYAPFQRGDGGSAVDPDARLETAITLDVPTKSFVTVGVLAELGPRVRIGLTYRAAQYIGVELPLQLNTRIGVSESFSVQLPVDALAQLKAKFHPQQVSLGVSYRRARWLLSAELSWINYAAYEIPYARISLDIRRLNRDQQVRLLLGPNPQLLDPLEPRVRFSDMLVPRVGGELIVKRWLHVRAGYHFERSPLRDTELPTYDGDKHGFAIGARATFLRPWGVIPGRLSLDVALQELVYVGRRIVGSDVSGHVFCVFSGIELVFL